jgi:hypothetical protein
MSLLFALIYNAVEASHGFGAVEKRAATVLMFQISSAARDGCEAN